jgi:hypothetical protein
MKPVRWDNIAASAVLSIALIISANLIAPSRYSAFALAGGVYIRVDGRSGEIMTCTYGTGCQRTWVEPKPDQVDNLMANAANEIGNSN